MFEFDAAKSRSNLAKHGIDFFEAQELWDDPTLLEVPARTLDEPRLLVVGSHRRQVLAGCRYIPQWKHSDHLCTALQR